MFNFIIKERLQILTNFTWVSTTAWGQEIQKEKVELQKVQEKKDGPVEER